MTEMGQDDVSNTIVGSSKYYKEGPISFPSSSSFKDALFQFPNPQLNKTQHSR